MTRIRVLKSSQQTSTTSNPVNQSNALTFNSIIRKTFTKFCNQYWPCRLRKFCKPVLSKERNNSLACYYSSRQSSSIKQSNLWNLGVTLHSKRSQRARSELFFRPRENRASAKKKWRWEGRRAEQTDKTLKLPFAQERGL